MRHLRFVRALLVAVTLVAALGASGARAEIPWCVGTIVDVYVTVNGDVVAMPSWRGTWIQYCNLNWTRDNVTPKTCSAWYAALLLAHQTQKSTVTAYWGNAVESCATWADYERAPAPTYFRLQ